MSPPFNPGSFWRSFKTGWPINDYSIKNLASYLGFHWRDKSPSGAEFIE